MNIKKQQITNIVMITFWSQFSSYALNTILILFLTRPLIEHGLHYDQAKAYAFMGVSSASGYLMLILGGYMADQVLGVRRSILLGSLMLASSYLLVVLSGCTIPTRGDSLFLAAYALLPAANSLLIGTASALVSRIYADNVLQAKSAMTYYYLAINIGALLAAIIAPGLMENRYGPLSVLTLAFIGKSIAALNFAYRYSIYDNIASKQDGLKITPAIVSKVTAYLCCVYGFIWFSFTHLTLASLFISIGCALGISYFFIQTCMLPEEARYKQLVASFLILEAIVFFVIYNQMNSTLILFAERNTDLRLFWFTISPAQYQLLNPLLIIAIGLKLPHFYKKFPHFTIPYQFACGTLLAGCGLLVLAFGATHAENGIVNGNILAITYLLISLAELWVSAIGLSMIGLYCDNRHLAFAMGTWYLAGSLSNTISAHVAQWVAIPEYMTSRTESLTIYHNYYLNMGLIALLLGLSMLVVAYVIRSIFNHKGYSYA